LKFFVIFYHLFQFLGLSLVFDILLTNLDEVYLQLDDRNCGAIYQVILLESVDIIELLMNHLHLFDEFLSRKSIEPGWSLINEVTDKYI
jgi:hypothetical protein